MLESSISVVDDSVEHNEVGPDYFGFYVSELTGLLNKGKDLCSLSQKADREMCGGVVETETENNDKRNTDGHLFSDSIGALLPELNMERLHSLLRQSVTSLSQEVDEMVDPVFSICRLKECLKYKKSLADVTAQNGTANSSVIDKDNPKRIRLSNFSAVSETNKLDVILPTKASSDAILKDSASHLATQVSEPLCNSNGSRLVEQCQSPIVGLNTAVQKENRDIDEDLQFLLESDSSEVEEVMKKHADEILATIEHMERMLEKLLQNVTSTCRPMTRIELHNLKKLIKNLPPKNLERVAEIIQNGRPVGETSSTEMHVDLEKEDTGTLWRLYYYVKTVERAQQQCRTLH